MDSSANNHANITPLLKWVSTVLDKQEISPNIVVETPWSLVIRIEIGQDCYYLKQTPADLFIETEIINIIQKNMPNSPTPKILFENHALNCFLMKSCGDHSLRTKFKGTIDEKLLIKGLHIYINIQRSVEKNLDHFISIGVPDWRIHRIPDLFTDLLEKKDLLREEGLKSDEIDQLMRLDALIKSICKFLSEQKIKETLVNCDFNENNMIMKEETQQIFLVDWGESVISHPFLNIAAHLENNARRYQLDIKGQLLESIKQKCLSCWLDVVNKDELDEIYQNMVRLLPIFSSLGIYRLQAATHNNSKKMQRWFIADSLQTLLKNERQR